MFALSFAVFSNEPLLRSWDSFYYEEKSVKAEKQRHQVTPHKKEPRQVEETQQVDK